MWIVDSLALFASTRFRPLPRSKNREVRTKKPPPSPAFRTAVTVPSRPVEAVTEEVVSDLMDELIEETVQCAPPGRRVERRWEVVWERPSRARKPVTLGFLARVWCASLGRVFFFFFFSVSWETDGETYTR